MMRVLYSPQFSDKKIKYTFYKDTVMAQLDETTVFFDFNSVENGKDYQVNHELILNVSRVEDELYLTVLDYIDDDCPPERKFPELSVVTESKFELGEDVIKPSLVASLIVDNSKEREIEELKARLKLAEEQATNATQATLELGDMIAELFG